MPKLKPAPVQTSGSAEQPSENPRAGAARQAFVTAPPDAGAAAPRRAPNRRTEPGAPDVRTSEIPAAANPEE
jgi:hypothetical protein